MFSNFRLARDMWPMVNYLDAIEEFRLGSYDVQRPLVGIIGR